VGIDRRGDWQIAWPQGAALDELTGTEQTLGTTVSLAGGGEQVRTTINPAGGGTTAWVATVSAAPVVDVREDYAHGAFQFAQLGGNVPGPIGGFQLGGSGEGDALLTWTQGLLGQAEVVGAFVQAPPAPFNLVAPFSWVRGQDAAVSWERSPDAIAGVTYTVYVDGKPRIGGLAGLSANLSPVALGDGVHRIQILATDPSGQRTMSGERDLKVDANPPVVKVAFVDQRRGVRVTISDKASGVNVGALAISFGDGHRSMRHKKVKHLYTRAGTYTITAFVRDKAGNSATVHLRVTVR
jgi:hypothetical protein